MGIIIAPYKIQRDSALRQKIYEQVIERLIDNEMVLTELFLINDDLNIYLKVVDTTMFS